ncbi:energy transducer TonB [Flavobacterium sp. FlaQc-28]|uniref:energy transducer TonB n=1 Tax=Flavobacterium sp. FlaQc-28 TaxID=3374178 RepID=UPI0037567742
MKNIKKYIKVLLLMATFHVGIAQEYKKINSSSISYLNNGFLSNNFISIENVNKTKLKNGFYEMNMDGRKMQFYINEKGNVDGTFKEYNSNGVLAIQTLLSNGALISMTALDSNGKTIEGLNVGKDAKSGHQFFNRKKYNSLGLLVEQIDYNWDKKEIKTSNYENKKLVSEIIIFDEYKIWNSNGDITEAQLIHPKNTSYKIEKKYYPNGKLKSSRFIDSQSIEGELKEYTEAGVLIKNKKTSNSKTVNVSAKINNEKIYKLEEVELKPSYPAGIDSYYKFFYKNFVKPNQEGLQGTIYLDFIVEKDGSLSAFRCFKDIGYATGAEAIRVLKLSPKWNPAKIGGKKVRCVYVLKVPIK